MIVCVFKTGLLKEPAGFGALYQTFKGKSRTATTYEQVDLITGDFRKNLHAGSLPPGMSE